MRRVSKGPFMKRGFTLLEVVLAIAIMLILTTMMMNGFAATMSYSYHTSIYSRTAASNYATAVSNLGVYSKLDKAAYEVMGAGYGSFGTNDMGSVRMYKKNPVSGALAQEEDFNIQLFREYKGFTTDAGFSSQKENYTTGDDDGSYSNNRTSFYYLPKYLRNGSDEKTRGKVVVYYIPKDSTFAHWGSSKKFAAGYYWYDTVNGYPLHETPLYSEKFDRSTI